MSRPASDTPGPLKPTERVRADRPGPSTMIAQRAFRFLPSARRMLRQLGPERHKVGLVFLLALVSAGLTAIAPLILARATDLMFAGVFGRQFPADLSRTDAVESLRAENSATTEMVAALEHFVPGQGIDFEAVGLVLVTGLAVYLAAGLLGWLQGIC